MKNMEKIKMNRDYCYIDDVLETKNKGKFDPENIAMIRIAAGRAWIRIAGVINYMKIWQKYLAGKQIMRKMSCYFQKQRRRNLRMRKVVDTGQTTSDLPGTGPDWNMDLQTGRSERD